MSQEIEEIRAEAVKLKEVLETSLRSPALSESKTTPAQRIEAAKNGMKNLREATVIVISLIDRLAKIERGIPNAVGWYFAASLIVFSILYVLYMNWKMGLFS